MIRETRTCSMCYDRMKLVPLNIIYRRDYEGKKILKDKINTSTYHIFCCENCTYAIRCTREGNTDNDIIASLT